MPFLDIMLRNSLDVMESYFVKILCCFHQADFELRNLLSAMSFNCYRLDILRRLLSYSCWDFCCCSDDVFQTLFWKKSLGLSLIYNYDNEL